MLSSHNTTTQPTPSGLNTTGIFCGDTLFGIRSLQDADIKIAFNDYLVATIKCLKGVFVMLNFPLFMFTHTTFCSNIPVTLEIVQMKYLFIPKNISKLQIYSSAACVEGGYTPFKWFTRADTFLVTDYTKPMYHGMYESKLNVSDNFILKIPKTITPSHLLHDVVRIFLEIFPKKLKYVYFPKIMWSDILKLIP